MSRRTTKQRRAARRRRLSRSVDFVMATIAYHLLRVPVIIRGFDGR